MAPNYSFNQIFTVDEETQLSNYLQTATKLHHGFSSKNAFELALTKKKYLNCGQKVRQVVNSGLQDS